LVVFFLFVNLSALQVRGLLLFFLVERAIKVSRT